MESSGSTSTARPVAPADSVLDLNALMSPIRDLDSDDEEHKDAANRDPDGVAYRKRPRPLRLELADLLGAPPTSPLSSPTSPFFRQRSRRPLSVDFDELGKRSGLYEWREIQPSGSGPPPMSGLSASYYNRTLYVFGGYNTNRALDDLFAFDLDTHTWRALETVGQAPSARTSHSAAVDVARGKLYVCCGSGSYFGHTNMDDFYELDLHLCVWRRLTFEGDALKARYGQSVVLYDRKLFVFGGTFGREFSQEFFVLDLDTRRCRLVPTDDTFPTARYKHAAGLFGGNKMLVFGGAERSNYKLNDVLYCNLDTLKWTKLDCSGEMPGGRFAHSMCIHNDVAYVFGGTDREACRADLFALDIHARAWRKLDCSGVLPRGRYFHGSIFDDERGDMVSWGGKGSTEAQVRFQDLHAICVDPPGGDPAQRCSLADDMRALLIAGEGADLRVVAAGGQAFAAHRLVVQARAPKLLSQAEAPGGVPIDDLAGDDDALPCLFVAFASEVVLALLEFLYSDRVAVGRGTTVEHCLELLYCAQQYDLPRLAALCEQRIRRAVDVARSLRLLDLMQGREPRLSSLERFLVQYARVQTGQALGPGRPDGDDEAGVLAIPASRLRADLSALRRLTMLEARAASVAYDTRFECGDDPDPVWAHQVILAARSRYFGSYSFTQGMAEASTRVCVFPARGAGVLSKGAFDVLLDYVYGGAAAVGDTMSEAVARELLCADSCNYFGLTTLHLHRVAMRALRASGGSDARDDLASASPGALLRRAATCRIS